MAEVKVKITAANQTQTGFQSVLADAQKTAAQVQQTFARASQGPRIPKTSTPDPTKVGPVDIGDYGLEPLRELQEQLKQAREASQQAFDPAPAEEFGGGVARSAGRMTLLAAGAAIVGKAIAAAFDQLSTAVKSAIGIQEQFNKTLNQVGNATNVSGVISEFAQLNSAAEQTGKVISETFGRGIGEAVANALSGRPGQLLARLADVATGGAVRGELEAGQQQQQRIARDTTVSNLARLDLEAFELSGAEGDPAEIARIKREQEKRRQIDELRSRLQGEDPQFVQQQENELRGLQAMEDKMSAQQRLFAAQQQASQIQEQTAQIGMTPQERLAQEKIKESGLQGELVGAPQGAQSMEEIAARVAEINVKIAQSKQTQAQLEKQISQEAEKTSQRAERGASVALELTGLETVAELESALDGVTNKTATVALEASGLENISQLKDALDVEDKTVVAKLEAAGFEDLDALRAKLDEVQPKQVDVILNALGAETIEEAKALLDSLDVSAINDINQKIRQQQEQIKEKTVADLERQIQRRDFSALSPDEQRAELDRKFATFEQQVASGQISPEMAAQQASELLQLSDSLKSQQSLEGSVGASAFQRIGFASNEFFDTRKSEDPAKETRRAAQFAKEILDVLKKGEPILLNSTSS